MNYLIDLFLILIDIFVILLWKTIYTFDREEDKEDVRDNRTDFN